MNDYPGGVGKISWKRRAETARRASSATFPDFLTRMFPGFSQKTETTLNA
jgi:hypothetical protein